MSVFRAIVGDEFGARVLTSRDEVNVVALVSMARRRQRLATAGLFGIAVFVVGLIALHVASLGAEPLHMSQFANSRLGGFWMLCVSSFIAGTSMLVVALRPCLGDSRAKQAGSSMLFLAGIGAVLLTTFPIDPIRPVNVGGMIHEGAAITTFTLLGAAMLVLTPAFRASRDLTRFAGASLALGILVNVTLALYFVTSWERIAIRGPAQRVLVAFIALWFTALALRLRKVGDGETGSLGAALARASVPTATPSLVSAASPPRPVARRRSRRGRTTRVLTR
jgi:hypothetical membrane protein